MEPITTLGTLLKGEIQRDAIHIAIMPVITHRDLYPGESVKLIPGTKNTVMGCERDSTDCVGIIDPFLEGYIPGGSQVWMFLNPNTITGLRHEWTHLKVDNNTNISDNEHEDWLRSFACKWNFDYDNMIKQATTTPTDDYSNIITAEGIDLHSRGELGDDHELFWRHIEALTGKMYDYYHREKICWSCSC